MRTLVETILVSKPGAAGSVTINRYSTGQMEFADVKGNKVSTGSHNIDLCKLLDAVAALPTA